MQITKMLDEQFTNFASYVIVNNMPSIDGLLPVQRKVLWAMHKNGVNSNKNYIKLHRAGAMAMVYYIMGDLPLFGAMKNMANNGLNYMYLQPKGSFGDKRKKFDDGASPRYVECRLSSFSECGLLNSINKNVVPMKRNFDNTEDEPIVLPSIAPNILTNVSQSIAVGMASKIPSHNLIDTCDSIINYINTNDINSSIKILKCPDFIGTQGKIVYDKDIFEKIYKTGRGSFSIVGNYTYNNKTNTLSITEVPYESYIEDIETKLEKSYEKGLFKEITDVHNASGVQGIQLDITLKKNTNIDQFIAKLRKYTPFESKFSCNFTILDLDGKTPKLMNLQDIYNTWIQHRINCIKNEILFDINKGKEELNKLYGLKIINEDLDKAIQIIRSSKTERTAMERLINYFKLNEKQAEYISTIRLVNINQEWIEKRITNIKELENKNIELMDYYNSEKDIKETIISQLEEIKKKFGKPRKTEIIYPSDIQDITKEDLIEDNTVTLILTDHGYIKKNLKYSETQKLKDDDEIIQMFQTTNKTDMLLFTNKGNVLLRKTYELEECLPSSYGTFISNWIGEYLQEDEKVIYVATTKDYKGKLITVFENGLIGCTDLQAYKCKVNRQVPMDAYNTESPLVDIKAVTSDVDIFLLSDEGKALIVNTKKSKIRPTKSRDTKGVVGIRLKNDNKVIEAIIDCCNDNFTIHTKKGKKIDYMLDDVATNTEKSWREYLTMRRGNQGNFMYNTRQKKDRIIKVTERKEI